ncbi:FG-GAP repeat domain-containing protein [Gloeobacter morelensis]|uniref:VCBS repeat-containing protein n=1 Tax=Gloeobacter morelensis MG652769 TaxID=2781736 RepID=A0ABY3PT56_9CYAN|nr:VCBS repeat-containing protein [Gloeobacter morelensis]UFP96682.1 VCBS repeat-containing protein [Gloeobacter morelensis MG652769]
MIFQRAFAASRPRGRSALHRLGLGLLAASGLCAALVVFSTSAPAQAPACARTDFNCDGKPDVVWRNFGTGADAGKNLVWYMDGLTYLSAVSLPAQTDLNWQIGGTGDFTADGKTDIVWRDFGSGLNYVWSLEDDDDDDDNRYGRGFTDDDDDDDDFEQIPLPVESDLDWQIVAVDNFGDSARPDILWQNTATGEVRVWYMNGAVRVSSTILGAESDLNWRIVGAGDFNGDAKPDILWRNYGSGSEAGTHRVWYLDGTTFTESATFSPVSNLDWEIVGVGDYGKLQSGSIPQVIAGQDGQTDIVWRNKVTGESALWLMNGITFNLTGYLPQVVNVASLNAANGLPSTTQIQGTPSPWSAITK